jgi:hypothetical protein
VPAQHCARSIRTSAPPHHRRRAAGSAHWTSGRALIAPLVLLTPPRTLTERRACASHLDQPTPRSAQMPIRTIESTAPRFAPASFDSRRVVCRTNHSATYGRHVRAVELQNQTRSILMNVPLQEHSKMFHWQRENSSHRRRAAFVSRRRRFAAGVCSPPPAPPRSHSCLVRRAAQRWDAMCCVPLPSAGGSNFGSRSRWRLRDAAPLRTAPGAPPEGLAAAAAASVRATA